MVYFLPVYLTSPIVHFSLAETKYTGLVSHFKSIGKSTMMNIVSFGLGMDHINHPMIVAGGDGLSSGTSS